jgi:S1 RNA binding domain protein
MPDEEVQQPAEETPVIQEAIEASEAVQEPAAEASEIPSETPEEPEAAAAPAVAVAVEVGAVIEGSVHRIAPHGAFLRLPDGRLGLVHISEIDRNYVKDVHEHLHEGDTVQAKVLAIKEDGKIDLSIKALQDPQPRMDRRRGSDPGFEQMLRKFMRSSEERQVDLKRSVMHKRK